MSIELMMKVRALEARVEALEADNKKLRALVVQALERPGERPLFGKRKASKLAPPPITA